MSASGPSGPLVYLVSVAEETGLNLPLSETPKTGFLASRAICHRLSPCYICQLYTIR